MLNKDVKEYSGNISGRGAEIDSKAGIIGMTRNEEVNFLFSKNRKVFIFVHAKISVYEILCP